ncbi:MAG: M12 family metallo-peptidase, partial [Burkholderiales bacterium]
VQYTEGLFVTNDLAPLRRKGDHVMDIVHQWRDELYADVVVLITENQNSIPCGGAHQMRSPKHSFEAFAFAAIPRSCATGQYNFAHELGHVMGADHDWAQSNSLFPFEYSHGLTMPHPNDPTVPPWRTIMAENTACSGLPNGCVRVQYWSNPDSLWGDQQMGVNEGPRQADNRKTLNNTASIVANFRRSCSGQ